jgi:hypothetical protein
MLPSRIRRRPDLEIQFPTTAFFGTLLLSCCCRYVETANPASTEAMLCGAAAKPQAIDFSSWWVLFFFSAQRSFGVAFLYRLTWLTFGN